MDRQTDRQAKYIYRYKKNLTIQKTFTFIILCQVLTQKEEKNAKKTQKRRKNSGNDYYNYGAFSSRIVSIPFPIYSVHGR